MKPRKPRDRTVIVKMAPHVREKLEVLANARGLSLSALVRTLILEADWKK